MVFKLKITLRGIELPIWRRVLVRSDMSFRALSEVLQDAMGWLNCHLHVFEVEGRAIGFSDKEIDWDDPETAAEDGRKVRLDDVLVDRGTVFTYEYDFGDGWEHAIALEEILELDPRIAYPICIAGARACPPEDAGGVGGYEHLLEVLADPKHEEHDDVLTWVGGLYDPEGFDVNRVNAALHGSRR